MKPAVAIESMVLLIADDSRLKMVFTEEAPGINLCMVRSTAFDFLSWLRTEQFYEKVPVIALTSSEDSSIVNRADELGANGCLVKSRTAAVTDGIALLQQTAP